MEKRYHYTIVWDSAEGRDSRHLICTSEELASETEKIRKQIPNLWIFSTSRNDNPGSGAREYIIAYRDSSLRFMNYYFTGFQSDLEKEVGWLKENGAGYVKYELADPEPLVLHTERIKAVRAMEYLARCINDETIFDRWLSMGVADGDINENTPDEEIEYYCDDDVNFADLMDTFLLLMAKAQKSGGLFCDGVVSEAEA